MGNIHSLFWGWVTILINNILILQLPFFAFSNTIILINQTPDIIVGYEVREGSTTRNVKDAPVKSYRKSLIAKVKQIDTRCSLRKKAEGEQLNKTTLVRENLSDFVKTGP